MRLYFTIASCFALPLFAQTTPELIKDINPGTANSQPGRFNIISDYFLFLANDGTSGVELWRSDGTEAGTSLVKDIGGGLTSLCSDPFGCGDESIVMNDILYYRAYDAVNGAELWRSDGTEAGTYMVKDINPGAGNCSNSVFMNAQYFSVLNNVLYFAADGGGNNIELWRSDGTDAGTYMVKDFAAGASSIPQYITAIGDFIYFRCKNALGQPELWKSDGTDAGSVLLKQMWTYSPEYKNMFIQYDGYIYFNGDDGVDPYNLELWRTDGTPAGTQLFLNIDDDDSDGSSPHQFHILNDKLLFLATPTSGERLFISDGTIAGTQQLLDANGNEIYPSTEGFLPAQNKIYFNANNDDFEKGLWASDGTNDGTYFLSDFASGEFASYSATVVNGNNIVYSGYDDNEGCRTLFQSDGTISGTYQITECADFSSPETMITFNGNVILNVKTPATGNELFLFEPEFDVSIQEELLNKKVKLYPNPAGNFLTIFSENTEPNTTILITNSIGNTVYSSNLNEQKSTIDVHNLVPGIYVIQINFITATFIKL